MSARPASPPARMCITKFWSTDGCRTRCESNCHGGGCSKGRCWRHSSANGTRSKPWWFGRRGPHKQPRRTRPPNSVKPIPLQLRARGLQAAPRTTQHENGTLETDVGSRHRVKWPFCVRGRPLVRDTRDIDVSGRPRPQNRRRSPAGCSAVHGRFCAPYEPAMQSKCGLSVSHRPIYVCPLSRLRKTVPGEPQA